MEEQAAQKAQAAEKAQAAQGMQTLQLRGAQAEVAETESKAALNFANFCACTRKQQSWKILNFSGTDFYISGGLIYCLILSGLQSFTARGSQTLKVVPCGSRELTSICPPWLRTIQ
jgi:hypothetical protein